MLLDAGVPDSVADVLKERGHHVILYREVLPEGETDTVVCATVLANGAILVAIDGDMKQLARRFGQSVKSERFKRLSIIRLGCNKF
jgi:predicted nuclease of predicted toxin-antitoxin system